jgi:hypothetical protein
MNTVYIPRPINTKPASIWILEHLKIAGADATLLADHINQGACFVIARADTPEDRLYAFEQGGITPPGKFYQAENCLLQPITNLSMELALIIKSSLMGKLKCSVCYLHDPLRNQPDEFHPDEGERTSIDGKTFFVARLERENTNTLDDIISVNGYSWHFQMICPKAVNREYKNTTEMALDSDCIVTGVYDGESYLIWTREPCLKF